MLESLIHIDRSVLVLINQKLANPLFDVIMPLLREGSYWIPLYAVMLFFWVKWHGKKTMIFLLFVLATIGLSDYLASGLFKPHFKRPRPCYHPEVSHQITLRKASGCGGKYGFASSHASNHFALAFWFYFLTPSASRKGYHLLWWLWAASIALAQVYVGVHYPSDTLMGAMLGILSASLFYRLLHLFYQQKILNNPI